MPVCLSVSLFDFARFALVCLCMIVCFRLIVYFSVCPVCLGLIVWLLFCMFPADCLSCLVVSLSVCLSVCLCLYPLSDCLPLLCSVSSCLSLCARLYASVCVWSTFCFCGRLLRLGRGGRGMSNSQHLNGYRMPDGILLILGQMRTGWVFMGSCLLTNCF